MRAFRRLTFLSLLFIATFAAVPAFAMTGESGDSHTSIAGEPVHPVGEQSLQQIAADDITVTAAQYSGGYAGYYGDWTAPWSSGNYGSYYPGYSYAGYYWPNYYANVYRPYYSVYSPSLYGAFYPYNYSYYRYGYYSPWFWYR